MAGGSERSSGSSTSLRRRDNIAVETYITTGGRNSRKQIQIKANKRKQNCFLLFSFIYVYFFELGLFNGLRPIQIKKFGSPVSGCRQSLKVVGTPSQMRSILFSPMRPPIIVRSRH